MDEITYFAVQAILHGMLGAVMIMIAIVLSPGGNDDKGNQ